MNSKMIVLYVVIFLFTGTEALFADSVFNAETNIISGGTTKKAKQWYNDYWQCKNATNFQRGEYETNEEFANRKANLLESCDSMNPIDDAKIFIPSELRYNADNFVFDIGFGDRPEFESRIIRGNDRKPGETTVNKVYKAKFMRNVVTDYSERFFDGISKISVPTKSYYDINLSSYVIRVKSEITKARSLKVKEPNLKWVFTGKFYFNGEWSNLVKDLYIETYTFEIHEISLLDMETDRSILIIK